jgi:hypothetical protein
MHNIESKKISVSAHDSELIECVIQAACVYYGVGKAELMHDTSMVKTRHLCFFAISRSTNLKDYVIGTFFGKKRTAIKYGIDTIDVHKEIYRQTLDDLNNIIHIANNFEKKYSWHIQSINTMYSQKQ